MSKRDELIEAVREMATACWLQNAEQISEERGAIGAVRMIQRQYLSLAVSKSKPDAHLGATEK